jgi:hypothetical protein
MNTFHMMYTSLVICYDFNEFLGAFLSFQLLHVRMQYLPLRQRDIQVLQSTYMPTCNNAYTLPSTYAIIFDVVYRYIDSFHFNVHLYLHVLLALPFPRKCQLCMAVEGVALLLEVTISVCDTTQGVPNQYTVYDI